MAVLAGSLARLCGPFSSQSTLTSAGSTPQMRQNFYVKFFLSSFWPYCPVAISSTRVIFQSRVSVCVEISSMLCQFCCGGLYFLCQQIRGRYHVVCQILTVLNPEPVLKIDAVRRPWVLDRRGYRIVNFSEKIKLLRY